MLDDDFEDNYELIVEKHKVLEAVKNLAVKWDSMIRLLQIILTILSLYVMYFCVAKKLLRVNYIKNK